VDTALNQNQSELGVLIPSVSLQMLSDLNSLLDQHVKILRDLRSQTCRFNQSFNTKDRATAFSFQVSNDSVRDEALNVRMILCSAVIFSAHTVLLQDAKDLATSNALDLSDAVGVTKHHTNLKK